MKLKFAAFIAFLKKLFPFGSKTASKTDEKAPAIDAVKAPATPVATSTQVVSKDPVDHSVTGAVIGTVTEALLGGKPTGNGTQTSPTGPFPPAGPTQVTTPGVLDIPGQKYPLVKGLNTFVVPVRGNPVLIETADFYDLVAGTLYDSAGNVLVHSADNGGHLYIYYVPSRNDDLRLEVQTDTDNPAAGIERKGSL